MKLKIFKKIVVLSKLKSKNLKINNNWNEK